MIIYLKIEIIYISRYRYTDIDVYILRYLYLYIYILRSLYIYIYIYIQNYRIYDSEVYLLYSTESWDTDKQNKNVIVEIIKVQTDK